MNSRLGELASLVGVEYVGPSLAEGLGQGRGTKAGLQSSTLRKIEKK